MLTTVCCSDLMTSRVVIHFHAVLYQAYPKDGECTFESIYMEVDGKPVTPTWTAAQERPACNSKCEVVDSKTIKFTWDDSSTEGAAPPAAASNSTAAASLKVPPPLPKWGYGKLL